MNETTILLRATESIVMFMGMLTVGAMAGIIATAIITSRPYNPPRNRRRIGTKPTDERGRDLRGCLASILQ